MAARALLFDLDGTVWDSFPWYAAVIAEKGGVIDVEARLRAGTSILPVASECGLSRARFFRACATTAAPLHLYAGVVETLDALVVRGTPLGAVTSLPRQLAEVALRKTGLTSRFASVVDASHGGPYKPNPRPLRLALSQMGLVAGRDIYYVGDVATDGQAAHAAGLSFAWTSYGYGTADTEADAIINQFPDVLAL